MCSQHATASRLTAASLWLPGVRRPETGRGGSPASVTILPRFSLAKPSMSWQPTARPRALFEARASRGREGTADRDTVCLGLPDGELLVRLRTLVAEFARLVLVRVLVGAVELGDEHVDQEDDSREDVDEDRRQEEGVVVELLISLLASLKGMLRAP
jgi:hypothetical protein